MEQFTAEYAAKVQIFERRIRRRYEQLRGQLSDDRQTRILTLPMSELVKMADALDRADPNPQTDHDRADAIVEDIYWGFVNRERKKEQAEFEASGPPAMVSMDPCQVPGSTSNPGRYLKQ